MTSTPAKVEPRAVVRHELERYKPIIAKLLRGTGTSEETFVAQVANAYRQNRELGKCDPETVLGAALRCAQIGLPPNDGNNLAWIIGYGREAQFQLGYGGVLELARRAEPGLRFEGRPVYPNDTFDLDYGDLSGFTHRPAIGDRGGPAVAWYVLADYPDGRRHIHVLNRDDVERHRSFSKQPNGEMWTKSYDAAALKSVVLDMRRWLPVSPQLAQALQSEGQVHDVRDMDDDDPAELDPAADAAPTEP